ncbi:MAG: hypothetical protein ICV83_21015, partial [Cytophagales bacterium]|nr:hypothetical protein [Cytophagales bacterium]
DRDGSLFLTTQYSLFRWHGPTGRVEAFGARDGLLDQSYAFNTAYRLRDGRVLLGTVHDFYAFHPDRLSNAEPPPQSASPGSGSSTKPSGSIRPSGGTAPCGWRTARTSLRWNLPRCSTTTTPASATTTSSKAWMPAGWRPA